jgi:hypothetical protein
VFRLEMRPKCVGGGGGAGDWEVGVERWLQYGGEAWAGAICVADAAS